jgi:transcription elongation factor GreA
VDFITAQEKSQLEQRIAELEARRAVITKRIAEARAMGDLSENAEYHAAREDQGLNEAEIRRLQERLVHAQIADAADVPQDMVFVGATVKVRDTESEAEEVYKLVGQAGGAFNFDSDEIEVTTSSPMGEALMKARIGDVVKVDLPKGIRRFQIVEIL